MVKRDARARSRLRLILAAAGTASALALGAWLWPRPGPPPLEATPAPHRWLEARLSHPDADGHRPLRIMRSSDPQRGTVSHQALAALEKRGDERGIAAAYLLAGNARQAEARLRRLPESPDRQSDLGAVAIAEQRWTRALELLEQALARQDRHPQALWNRALALGALGLDRGAVEAWRALAALGEPGWSEEAAARARALGDRVQERRRIWEERQRQRRALLAGTALPPTLVAARPDLARSYFYDALRAASTPAALAALAPLARALDTRQGGTVLAAALVAAGTGDLRRRAPAAAGYAALIEERPAPGAAALVRQAREAGAPALLFGVLVATRRGFQHSDELVSLAAGDPYLGLVADGFKAAAELQIDRRPAAAERRLEEAIGRCEAARFGRLCTELRLTMAWLLSREHRAKDAREQAVRALAAAGDRGDEDQVSLALARLTGGALLVRNRAETRAYLEERLLRDPESCDVRADAAEALATLALDELDFTEARRQVARAVGCPSRGLARIGVLAALVRQGGMPAEEEALARAIRDERDRADGQPASSAAMTLALEGEAALAREPERARALLRRAAALSESLPAEDDFASGARRASHLALAFDAARRGAFAEAFGFIAAAERAGARGGCALALAADRERLAGIARGPDGALVGFHRTATRLPHDPATLVPPALHAALANCPSVGVVAPAPLYGQPRLLPPAMAWSYIAGSGAPGPPRASPERRVVFSDVAPPAHLGLDPLGLWSPRPAPGQELLHLRGREVTRDRALAAMADADSIELHVHGMLDPAVSDVSFLVLSPDAAGAYTLTDADIRERSLGRRPVVVLAACHAGERSRAHHWAWGLPRAFLAAGARAVLAAPVPIPDQEGGVFFEAVAARIAGGVAPAVALRDQRRALGARAVAEPWVDEVMVFE